MYMLRRRTTETQAYFQKICTGEKNGQFPFSFLFVYSELSYLQHRFMPYGMTFSYTLKNCEL